MIYRNFKSYKKKGKNAFFSGEELSKYHSKSCRCPLGHYHRSIMEAQYCAMLELERKAGVIVGFEKEKTFPLKVDGKLVCSHRVDFWVEVSAGVFEVHEVKGFATEIWRLKHKLFRIVYPDIVYKILTCDKRGQWRIHDFDGGMK